MEAVLSVGSEQNGYKEVFVRIVHSRVEMKSRISGSQPAGIWIESSLRNSQLQNNGEKGIRLFVIWSDNEIVVNPLPGYGY
jgi:hypothetical protein